MSSEAAIGKKRLLAASLPEQTTRALADRRGAASDRPALRADLAVRRQVQMGEVRWIVKNPERRKYYIFEDFEWRLIELFDGSRTREEVVAAYNELYPFDPLELSVILDYEEMLRKLDLVSQSVAERSLGLLAGAKTARQRAAEEKAEGFNVFFLLFHVLDPDRFLDRTVRFVRWIWTPPVVAVWAIAVAWTVGVFAIHFQELWAGTYELYAFLHKPFLDAVHFFFILSFLGFFHEFGHAYAVKIYGGEVHDIGIALLYFTPAFYCDTTDALLFPNKWHRLWVNTAGIYFEGFVCSAATAVWVASYPDTLLNELAYKTMLFTGISTIFFNVNPLIKIDGYHALTSVLEMPELREDSFKYLGAIFQKHILRLPAPLPPVGRRRRRIYWIYGVLALAYTVVIMRLIGGIFFNLYSRLFPDFAVILLVLTLLRIFRKRVRIATRTARLAYLDKKELLMSRRARKPVLAAFLVLLVLLFVPWTHKSISATGTLRPARVFRVEAPEDSSVESVLARENEPLADGQPIFRLTSASNEADVARFSAQKERLSRSAEKARDAGVPGDVFERENRADAAAAGVHDAVSRGDRLTLRSPGPGRILTARVDDLAGRQLRAGSLLAEIGDCRTMVADLPVSERLLDELAVGAPVRAFVTQDPLSPLHGKLVRISTATLDQPRTSDGVVETKGPTAHPERFVAVAEFQNPGGRLLTGAIVRARIQSKRASYAARTGRVIGRWLQTIFW